MTTQPNPSGSPAYRGHRARRQGIHLDKWQRATLMAIAGFTKALLSSADTRMTIAEAWETARAQVKLGINEAFDIRETDNLSVEDARLCLDEYLDLGRSL
ncbi:MAG: hypothetical protein ACFCA4_18760 [Cyanophyceae cyanobacterium]